jgi:hypothetical protein
MGLIACLATASAGCGTDGDAAPRREIPADPAAVANPAPGAMSTSGASSGAPPQVPNAPGAPPTNMDSPIPMTPAAGAGGDPSLADGGAMSPAVDAGPATPSGGCGVPWVAADAQEESSFRGGEPMRVARREIDVNGTLRRYLIAVPTDYDAGRPYPLIFGFHGLGGDREQLRRYMNVEAYVFIKLIHGNLVLFTIIRKILLASYCMKFSFK